MDADEAGTLLCAAAFGRDAGVHPLPAATTARGRWHRAVALGGQGRMAAATAQLRRVDTPEPALASSVLSTRASHLRQFGAHDRARALDGAALLLAGGPDPVGEGPPALLAARCDALVGLAADALGPGRTALALRLLEVARPTAHAAPTRCRIRWHWVMAETALYLGPAELRPDGGAGPSALAHTRGAQRLAAGLDSTRHQVKSDLLMSVVTGDDDLAERVLTRASELGLVPLAWAATMVLRTLGHDRRAARTALARTLHARGASPRVPPAAPR